MALNPAEFMRWLPGALGDLPWRLEGDRVVAGDAGQGVTFGLDPLPPRRIGRLSLPATRVTIAFHGFTATQATAFLARFDLAFRRGGG